MPNRKTELGWEIEESDRLGLICSAVDVVAILSRHQRSDADAWVPDKELSEAELNCYESALTMLATEFDLGARETVSHMTRSTETEFEPCHDDDDV